MSELIDLVGAKTNLWLKVGDETRLKKASLHDVKVAMTMAANMDEDKVEEYLFDRSSDHWLLDIK